jgi:hypothetical protein
VSSCGASLKSEAIIGLAWSQHEIGNSARCVAAAATSVGGDQARARGLRHNRTVRIGERPAHPAAARAGACGQAASHPRIGDRAAPFRGLCERASNYEWASDEPPGLLYADVIAVRQRPRGLDGPAGRCAAIATPAAEP